MEKQLPPVTASNGRSDLLGRVLGQGSGPGPGLTPSGPGPGVGQDPMVQELLELEGQILVIKQQLQTALKRKRELQQHQSENRQANQTAANQSTGLQASQFSQFSQFSQCRPQTNQHTNTVPEF